MPLAILCSGQGGQHPAMFATLAGGGAAPAILKKVEALTGLAVLGGPLQADPAALSANRTAQILVVGHALAAFAELQACGLEEPVVFAGYSAGEVAAHGCAGALGVSATLDLMSERADAMDAACGGGPPQGMLATIGVPLAEARKAAEEAGVAIAIVNGPDHVVAGGPAAALDAYEAAVAARARNVRRLGVQVASHTRWLTEAGDVFQAAVMSSGWRTPSRPVLSGLDGRPVRAREDAARLLAAQLHEPLDWARCLESVFEYGATATLEIGPGRALTRMVEEAYPGVPARAFEDFRTPDGVVKWAGRFG